MKRFSSNLLLSILLLVAVAIIPTAFSYAASCCGGGLPVPALILGDERANFSGSLTLAQIKTDVSAQGIWKDRSDGENAETVRLDAARIWNDRYQYGMSLPVLRRERIENSSGLGDVSLNAGYEFLTDWDYHPIRPKGVGFLQLVLPTGKSIQEAQTLDQVDSRGRGFWALGVGTAFTKVKAPFDALTIFEVHRSFKKDGASSSVGTVNLRPGWGGTLTAGAGYSISDFRMGLAATWIYEDAVRVSGAVQSAGDLMRYAVATLSGVYSVNDDWTAALSYSDQFLLGSPTNTALARSVQLNIQKRWAR